MYNKGVAKATTLVEGEVEVEEGVCNGRGRVRGCV